MENDVDVTVVIMVCFLLLIICFGSFAWKYKTCSSYGELTDRDVKYTVTNGCMIKFGNKFIPRSELERRNIMSNNDG